MSNYLGDYTLSTSLYTKFTTVNASGVPTTLGNSPTYGFYQDANVTLFTAGVTVTNDFNSTTGLNHLQMIVTTSATGIAAGSSYQLVIQTGSVSGVSMKGYVVGQFSVLTRSPLRPTTAGQTLLVNASGAAAIDWSSVSNPGATVSLSATTLFTATNVTNQVNANVTSISTVVNANVTSISTVVNANVTSLSTGVSVNGVVNANVTSISTVVNANVTSISTVVNANVTSNSTVVNANVTSVGASALVAIQSGLATPTNITAGTFTTLSGNVNGSVGSLATQAKTDVENAVWEATAASHNNAGTMGNKLNSAASAGDPWGTALPGAYTTGTAGNILGTRLDVTVSSRMATYTQPTGFLAATFPTGTIANTTNITAGTITTTTNLTTNNDKTGYSLTQAFPSNFAALVVSASGNANVDVKKVNAVTVNGIGTAGNPWGP